MTPADRVAEVLARLSSGPARITTLIAGIASARLHAAPAPGEWSASDVLAHLRSCADVWGGCIARMLADDRPTIRHLSPRTWIRRTDYREQPFDAALRAFTAQRDGLLAVLNPLAPEQWARSATVKKAGKVLTRTVLSYAEALANHEQLHIEQIAIIARAARV